MNISRSVKPGEPAPSQCRMACDLMLALLGSERRGVQTRCSITSEERPRLFALRTTHTRYIYALAGTLASTTRRKAVAVSTLPKRSMCICATLPSDAPTVLYSIITSCRPPFSPGDVYTAAHRAVSVNAAEYRRGTVTRDRFVLGGHTRTWTLKPSNSDAFSRCLATLLVSTMYALPPDFFCSSPPPFRVLSVAGVKEIGRGKAGGCAHLAQRERAQTHVLPLCGRLYKQLGLALVQNVVLSLVAFHLRPTTRACVSLLPRAVDRRT